MKVDPDQVRDDFVPGELLVKLRPGLSRAQERAVHRRFGARLLERIGRGMGVHRVKLPRGLEVAEAARRYASNPAVEVAEPNFYRFPGLVPDDPRYADGALWGLSNMGQTHPVADGSPSAGTPGADIHADEAWPGESGDAGVIIGVLDSGIDVGHPDLDGNLWVNPDDPPGDLDGDLDLDDDHNGYPDDIFGWDFAQDDGELLDPSTLDGWNHGTHVAGTIAAETNNGQGIAGVCGGDGTPDSGCTIMVLKFMKPTDIDRPRDGIPDVVAGTLAAELEAIAYARAKGVHIINGSFGGPSWTSMERNAIRLATDILFVVAAGNASLDNDMALAADTDGDFAADAFSPVYPASYNLSNILSVAASNHHDEYGYHTGCHLAGNSRPWCAFTSFGRYSVDVAAPGVDVLSTLPADDYGTFNGTSMAAPHAAGVAGLLKAQDVTRSPLAIKHIIMATASRFQDDGVTPLPLKTQLNTRLSLVRSLRLRAGAQSGSFTRTSGRVNANDALNVVGPPVNGSAHHDGDIPGAKRMRGRARGRVAWPEDVNDIKKKKLRKGHTYLFTLAVPAGKDYDLYLLRPGTTEIWQPGRALRWSFDEAGVDESFTYRARTTKVHYIHVASWFSDGRYTLRVRCLTC